MKKTETVQRAEKKPVAKSPTLDKLTEQKKPAAQKRAPAVTEAIDQILATLYANDVAGYRIAEPTVLKSEALKRIKEKLSTLDTKTQKPLKDNVEYRLQEFDRFHELPMQERLEIVRFARMNSLSYEQAKERLQRS